ncbi:hypothetical protein OC844_006525, partial [Tilletia horrida]
MITTLDVIPSPEVQKADSSLAAAISAWASDRLRGKCQQTVVDRMAKSCEQEQMLQRVIGSLPPCLMVDLFVEEDEEQLNFWIPSSPSAAEPINWSEHPHTTGIYSFDDLDGAAKLQRAGEHTDARKPMEHL